MAKKAKNVSINPKPQTVTSEQFLNNLGSVIQQAPQVTNVLIAAINKMGADTGKNVLEYLAEAAGLEKAGENVWKPKEVPKPEVAEATSTVEEGV